MPKTESRGLLTRRPLWLIACYQNNRMRMLTVDPGGDGGFLPVFSFEEEAQTFLALDPLPPLTFVARTMLPLMRVKRELFVRYLMGERKERSGAVVAA